MRLAIIWCTPNKPMWKYESLDAEFPIQLQGPFCKDLPLDINGLRHENIFRRLKSAK